MKIQLLLKHMFLLCVFALSSSVWGQTTTFFNFTSSYVVPPAAGWTSAGAVEGGSYLKIAGGSVSSPLFDAATNIVFKYDIAAFGSGTNMVSKLIILNSSNTVLNEYTLTAASSSTYVKNQTVNVGSVGSQFKVKIEGGYAGAKATRLQNYSLVGDVVASGPAITATPSSLTGFTYIAGSGPSAEQTFTASGANLTNVITITAPANFEVSTTSGTGFGSAVTLTQTGGNVASTTLYVRMNAGLPVNTYGGNMVLTSTGATAVHVALNGDVTVVPLGIPVATLATDITSNSFVANWNAASGADSYELDVYQVTGSPAADLIFSEYIEGSGNNKFIEIYNGTGSEVNLSDYKINLYTNGSTTASAQALTGILPNGATLVYRNGQATLNTTFEVSSITNFNGDDALALVKGSPEVFVDIFGVIGNDPGTMWSINGVSTVDQTLRRKSNIKSGVKTNPSGTGSGAFLTLGTEWDSYPIDTAEGLGSHTFNGLTKTFVIENQNVGNVTSYPVSGLNAETNYYYVVRAKSEAAVSGNSNEIEVTTLGTPQVTWDGSVWSNGTGPDATMDAIISADYNEATAINAKSLTVNAGVKLVVNTYVETGNVTSNGEITVANNANFVHTGTFTAGTSSAFKVNRLTNPVQRLDYNSWSSPLKNSAQTLKQFSPATLDARFLTYNNGLYQSVTNPSGATFNAAQGYLIRTPNNYTTTPEVFSGVFEGTEPNAGPVSYDPSGITGDFVFLGNPYPSAISMADFVTANPQIDGTFYIWDSSVKMINNAYSGNNYVTHTSAGSVPAGSPFIVPVAQGFFVNRGASANAFTFNNAMRRTVETGVFAKEALATDRFWLQMTAPSGAKPQMLIGFFQNGTAGYDTGLDGKMFETNADVIYSNVDNNSLIINALGTFNTDEKVNVTANFLADGNYTIGLAQKEGIFAGSQKIYLKDNVTGTETELTAGDYSFAATAGLQNDRFTVYFKFVVLGNSDVTVNQSIIYVSGNTVHAKAKTKIAGLEVYDMSGKVIKKLTNINSDKASLPMTYTGVALVKMVLENGETVTKKIILN